MTIPRNRNFTLGLLLPALACLAVACAKSTGPGPRPPSPPETELTYAPLEGDTSVFRVHLYWNGFDRDGEVVKFRYAIDGDTLEPDRAKWRSTVATDTSLFLLVDPVKAIRGHVFWVSSEDNDHNIDPTPAKRFFSTATIPPSSAIVRGPSAFNPIIGPNFLFEWQGADPDGSAGGGSAPCESSQTLLLRLGTTYDTLASSAHVPLPPWNQAFYVNLIRASTGSALADPRYDDWRWSGLQGNSIRVAGAANGEYVFAERAVDPAGARETNLAFARNIRHFTVSNRNAGPTLSLYFDGGPLPATTGPTDFLRREIQVLEGEVISFAWSASAETYGGTIAGYTYALDDTTAFPALDVRNTGCTYRPQDIPVGLHFLFIRVVDDGGLQTNACIPFRVIHAAFTDPVSALNPPQYLYVDDALGPANRTDHLFNYPSDAEEDEWWRVNILTPLSLQYGMGRRDWDTFVAGAQNGGGGLRLQPSVADLAICRAVLWNVDFNNQVNLPTALYQTLMGGAQSELRSYLRAGGTLILSGFSVATNVVDPTTVLTSNFTRGICAAYRPGTIEYTRTFFAREMMGIDGARGAYEALRNMGARDFLEARVTPEGAAMGYASAEVDTGATAKWDGKIFPGDPNASWSPGLPRIEGWRMASSFNCDLNQAIYRREDPGKPISTPLFTYHGAPTGIYMVAVDGVGGAPSPRENLVVGVQVQAHDLGGMGGGLLQPGNSLGAIGRVVVLGFPLYFMKDTEATAIMKTAFEYVNASPTLPPAP